MKKKRWKWLFAGLLLPLLLLLCIISAAAEEMPYQFQFEGEPEEAVDSAYDSYLQQLPPEIRQQVEGAGDTLSYFGKECPWRRPSAGLKNPFRFNGYDHSDVSFSYAIKNCEKQFFGNNVFFVLYFMYGAYFV